MDAVKRLPNLKDISYPFQNFVLYISLVFWIERENSTETNCEGKKEKWGKYEGII